MKIIKIENLKGVKFDGGVSFRAVTAKDEVGFSVNKTVIPKGGPYHWHYQNHLEACYCISGLGTLKNLTTDWEYGIFPDTVYVLDKHDDHTFTALEDTVLISIFNPPLKGNETHDTNGNYAI